MIAFCLLVIFSLPLISADWFVDTQSKLPPCCRRDGKHGCSMMPKATATAGSLAVMATGNKCPLYPSAQASPAHSDGFVLSDSSAPVPLASGPRSVAQTEARYWVSFSRTRQKRGPPSLS